MDQKTPPERQAATSFVDKVRQSRMQAAAANTQSEPAEDKFFSILVGEVVTEHFLVLRFRSGMKTCFSYDDLLWFNYEPQSGTIDLEIGGYLITVKGRGLGDRLFQGIRQKRVAWLQEADVEMQDHSGNAVFIEEITITPPESSAPPEEGTA
jgi:hypothetical protein